MIITKALLLTPRNTVCLLAVAIALGVANPANAELVHRYTFNTAGSAADSVGGANGTLVGNAEVSGGGLFLDGDVNALTSVQFDAATIGINTLTDGFSFSVFAAAAAGQTGFHTLASAYGTNTTNAGLAANYFVIQPLRGDDVSRAAISISDDDSPWDEEDGANGTEFNDGAEHHYVATVTNSEISLYIDGALASTSPVGAANGGNAADNMISGLSTEFLALGTAYAQDPFWAGVVNQFDIYDTALTASEVAALPGPEGGLVAGLSLEVNRDTGAMTFNSSAGSINLVQYSIASAGGTINEGNWASVTSTDSDPDDTWEILAETANEISEQDPLGSGADNGVAVNPSVSIGTGVWAKSYIEDITATALICNVCDGSDDVNRPIAVSFVGNNDAAFSRSDFTLDGIVDADDYDILIANALTTLVGTTAIETHAEGDTNGDLLADFQDLRNFQLDFDAINGEGAFAALHGGTNVPEPSTAALLGGLLAAFLLSWRFCNRWRVLQAISIAPRAGMAVASMAAALLAANASAVTVAHWDFETDLIAGSAANGQAVSHPTDVEGAFDGAIQDLSGNGNHLSVTTPITGSVAGNMAFSNNVSASSDTGSSLSIEGFVAGSDFPGLFNDNTGNTGDLELGGSSVGSLNSWTVEASVNFKDVGGFQTLIGKDGLGQETGMLYDAAVGTGVAGDVNAAPFYFQKNGANGAFRIRWTAADGNGYILDSQTVPVANRWYNVAATSDGQNLSIYVNGILENTVDMVSLSGATAVMPALDETGFAGEDPSPFPYSWSVGRGMYNDGHGDRVNGFLDDVRISDEALTADQLLNGLVDGIQLHVSTEDGSVVLRNTASDARSIDYYEISSGASDLLTGDSDWNSLSDQGIDPVDGPDAGEVTGDGSGETWDELGGISSSILAEFFQQGGLELGPGESVSLGTPYAFSGGAEDLFLKISTKGGGLEPAPVLYDVVLQETLLGDADNDGAVAGSDLLAVTNNFGNTGAADGLLLGDADDDGAVAGSDLLAVTNNFGNTLGSLESGANVPEPTSVALTLLGASLILLPCRKLR